MHIKILSDNKAVAEFECNSPVVVGRQSINEPAPYQFLPPSGSDPARLIVAPFEEEAWSRHALRLEPLSKSRASVVNLSKRTLEIRARMTESLEAGSQIALALPFDVPISNCIVRITAENQWEQLDSATVLSKVPRPVPEVKNLPSGQLENILRWMQTTASVLQSTLTAGDFIPAAAAALVEIVGLDSGRVLLFRDGSWIEAACKSSSGAAPPLSQTVLNRVRAEKRTFWKLDDDREINGTAVLSQFSTVVAAPILESSGEVTGVLYGERRLSLANATQSIGKPEALLVEMLACGIANGLARQAQQDKAVAAEARFAQFFSRELAEQLARDPSLLEGREADVSMLFADLRGFSRISERVGAAETVKWISDVMDELSREVLAASGVLMDFIGDEMVAMWGAPTHQSDHPARAVRAALAMLDALPALSERWHARLGEQCHIGIGINSGQALVGNIGSKSKFKYGALGNTVNLASRVQGLTKYLKRPFLVTRATREHLGSEYIARRVCRARFVNIEQAIDLFEVAKKDPLLEGFFSASEAALDALEAGRFAESASMAGTLLGQFRGDGPLLLILSRAAPALVDGGNRFDPIWEPPGK